MTKRRSWLQRWLRRLHATRASLGTRLCTAWRALRARRHADRVEVLATDPAERRRLEREIRAALRRLRWVACPLRCGDVAVLVQRTVQRGHPVAGSALVGSQPDGGRFVLLQLATHVDGHTLAADELLATLAQLWIGVAVPHLGPAAVLVPVEPGPIPDGPRLRGGLAPDPLVGRTNGHFQPHADHLQ